MYISLHSVIYSCLWYILRQRAYNFIGMPPVLFRILVYQSHCISMMETHSLFHLIIDCIFSLYSTFNMHFLEYHKKRYQRNCHGILGWVFFQDTTTLVQIMVGCCQAPSHCLNQYWFLSLMYSQASPGTVRKYANYINLSFIKAEVHARVLKLLKLIFMFV